MDRSGQRTRRRLSAALLTVCGRRQASDNDRIAGSRIPQWFLQSVLKAPKIIKPSEKLLHDLLKPGGKDIGFKKGSARPGVRTVKKEEYVALKKELLDGAHEIPTAPGYKGKWYQRPDGSVVGVRTNEKLSETIEVVRSNDTKILQNGYKVHIDE